MNVVLSIHKATQLWRRFFFRESSDAEMIIKSSCIPIKRSRISKRLLAWGRWLGAAACLVAIRRCNRPAGVIALPTAFMWRTGDQVTENHLGDQHRNSPLHTDPTEAAKEELDKGWVSLSPWGCGYIEMQSPTNLAMLSIVLQCLKLSSSTTTCIKWIFC